MRSDLASDPGRGRRRRAPNLAAMSAAPLDGISGLADIRPPDANLGGAVGDEGPTPRQAGPRPRPRAARAGLLPSLGLRGKCRQRRQCRRHAERGHPGGIGLGLGADLRATDAVAEAAQARVGEAGEQAQRRLAQLNADLESAASRSGRGAGAGRPGRANFAPPSPIKQRARLRSVPELVGVLETPARRRTAALVELPYQVRPGRAADRRALWCPWSTEKRCERPGPQLRPAQGPRRPRIRRSILGRPPPPPPSTPPRPRAGAACRRFRLGGTAGAACRPTRPGPRAGFPLRRRSPITAFPTTPGTRADLAATMRAAGPATCPPGRPARGAGTRTGSAPTPSPSDAGGRPGSPRSPGSRRRGPSFGRPWSR